MEKIRDIFKFNRSLLLSVVLIILCIFNKWLINGESVTDIVVSYYFEENTSDTIPEYIPNLIQISSNFYSPSFNYKELNNYLPLFCYNHPDLLISINNNRNVINHSIYNTNNNRNNNMIINNNTLSEQLNTLRTEIEFLFKYDNKFIINGAFSQEWDWGNYNIELHNCDDYRIYSTGLLISGKSFLFNAGLKYLYSAEYNFIESINRLGFVPSSNFSIYLSIDPLYSFAENKILINSELIFNFFNITLLQKIVFNPVINGNNEQRLDILFNFLNSLLNIKFNTSVSTDFSKIFYFDFDIEAGFTPTETIVFGFLKKNIDYYDIKHDIEDVFWVLRELNQYRSLSGFYFKLYINRFELIINNSFCFNSYFLRISNIEPYIKTDGFDLLNSIIFNYRSDYFTFKFEIIHKLSDYNMNGLGLEFGFYDIKAGIIQLKFLNTALFNQNFVNFKYYNSIGLKMIYNNTGYFFLDFAGGFETSTYLDYSFKFYAVCGFHTRI